MCPVCKSVVRCGEAASVSADPEYWPSWATALSRFKKDEDTGVGDTAQRVFARLGGEAFKWMASKLGMPCGCTGRQADWNRLYPY